MLASRAALRVLLAGGFILSGPVASSRMQPSQQGKEAESSKDQGQVGFVPGGITAPSATPVLGHAPNRPVAAAPMMAMPDPRSDTVSNPGQIHGSRAPGLSRRQLLSAAAGGTAMGTAISSAQAFENAVSPAFYDLPARGAPTDLGVRSRDTKDGKVQGLKGCTGGTPNCFSTTKTKKRDPQSITPWVPPEGQDRDKTVEQIITVLRSYKPGQRGIDGAGFKIVEASPTKGYWYVQYQLPRGYIDDLEFALNEDNTSMMVRSSSRLGQIDSGVNAKRLNALAVPLKNAGWDIALITPETHQDYCLQNGFSG